MEDPVFLQQCFKFSFDKMGTSITYQYPGETKMREDFCLKEFCHNSGIVSWRNDYLNPFGHVVHHDQDILITAQGGEKTHKIYAPNIKHFYFKYVGQWSFVPSQDVSGSLTTVTFLYMFLSVLKHGGPVKPALKYFCYCLGGTCMASTR